MQISISIRRKVALSIIAYILVAAVLWMLNYYNSHLINQKFSLIEKKEDLLNTVLEARRYEKNFFLTHNSTHLDEALQFITLAKGKLEDIIIYHGAYATTPHLERILVKIDDYGASMKSMERSLGTDPGKAPHPAGLETNGGLQPVVALPNPDHVRSLGRELTETIEDMVHAERQQISRLIRDARIYHFFGTGRSGHPLRFGVHFLPFECQPSHEDP